jgi:hypothetical protein
MVRPARRAPRPRCARRLVPTEGILYVPRPGRVPQSSGPGAGPGLSGLPEPRRAPRRAARAAAPRRRPAGAAPANPRDARVGRAPARREPARVAAALRLDAARAAGGDQPAAASHAGPLGRAAGGPRRAGAARPAAGRAPRTRAGGVRQPAAPPGPGGGGCLRLVRRLRRPAAPARAGQRQGPAGGGDARQVPQAALERLLQMGRAGGPGPRGRLRPGRQRRQDPHAPGGRRRPADAGRGPLLRRPGQHPGPRPEPAPDHRGRRRHLGRALRPAGRRRREGRRAPRPPRLPGEADAARVRYAGRGGRAGDRARRGAGAAARRAAAVVLRRRKPPARADDHLRRDRPRGRVLLLRSVPVPGPLRRRRLQPRPPVGEKVLGSLRETESTRGASGPRSPVNPR